MFRLRPGPSSLRPRSGILAPSTTAPASPTSPPAPPPRISTVALGTAYELATLQVLSQPPLSLESLLRIGGSNDKGIDLRGFYLRRSDTGQTTPRRPKRVPILIQCKAVSKPLPPSIVREFEGVLATEPESLGILAAMNGFTDSAIKRAFASEFPVGLLRLGKGVLGRELFGEGGGELVREEDGSWDLGVNKAMREVVGEDVGRFLLSGVRRKWGEKPREGDQDEDDGGVVESRRENAR